MSSAPSAVLDRKIAKLMRRGNPFRRRTLARWIDLGKLMWDHDYHEERYVLKRNRDGFAIESDDTRKVHILMYAAMSQSFWRRIASLEDSVIWVFYCIEFRGLFQRWCEGFVAACQPHREISIIQGYLHLNHNHETKTYSPRIESFPEP